MILRRQVKRPVYRISDRAFLAARMQALPQAIGRFTNLVTFSIDA